MDKLLNAKSACEVLGISRDPDEQTHTVSCANIKGTANF